MSDDIWWNKIENQEDRSRHNICSQKDKKECQPHYGNYCGNQYGDSDYSIEFQDNIDLACKKHDYCQVGVIGAKSTTGANKIDKILKFNLCFFIHQFFFLLSLYLIIKTPRLKVKINDGICFFVVFYIF